MEAPLAQFHDGRPNQLRASSADVVEVASIPQVVLLVLDNWLAGRQKERGSASHVPQGLPPLGAVEPETARLLHGCCPAYGHSRWYRGAAMRRASSSHCMDATRGSRGSFSG